MFSSPHAYFLSVICAASHREPNITSGHKWPIPQKFYAQGSDIHRSVAPKFLLFCNKTILKTHNCCGYINMIAQSHLLHFFSPLVSTGSHFIAFKKTVKYYIDDITNPFSSQSCESLQLILYITPGGTNSRPIHFVRFLFCFWRDSPHWAMASSFTRFIQSVPGGMCQTSGGCSLC